MRIKNALVYTVEHGFVEQDVLIKNGCLRGVKRPCTDGEEILDAGGDYLIPGLVDIHFYGCAGHDFSGRNTGGIAGDRCVRACQGVTSICPASMTLSEETLKTVCQCVCVYKETGGRAGHRGETDRDSSGRTVYFHGEKGCAESGLYPESGCRDVPAAAGGSTRAGASGYDCTGDGRCQRSSSAGWRIKWLYLGRTYLQ